MHRTIEFWQIINRDHTPLTTNFPSDKLIEQMLAAKAAGKDLEAAMSDRSPLWLTPHNYNPNAPFLTLYKPRRENQSHMSDHGEIRNLPFGDEQFITEVTYLSFFDRNVVGFLYYFESPRPRRLAEYINIKFGAKIDLVPIYSRDLNRILQDMSASYVELTIPAAQAAQLTREIAGPFAAPLSAASRLLDEGSISLTVAVGRRGHLRARQRRKQELVNLARAVLPFRDTFESAKIVGAVGSTASVPVDLLEERFAHKIKVPAAVFIPNLQQIRDDTGIIRDQYAIDRQFLDDATSPIQGFAPDLGLIGEFRERRREANGDDPAAADGV